MRCHLKKCIQVAAGVLLLACVYIYMQRAQPADLQGWTWETESWPEGLNAHYLHFNVSIKVLAGVPQQFKRYLTVGLASVKREKGSYLQDTLQSIFSQSSETELAQMVVVVLLADFDINWIQQTLQQITKQFSSQLLKGQLMVIHADKTRYPPLTDLKRNFNDAPDRVSFRSKQNVDYAYLLHFCSDLSKYYLMLEDDVSCSKGFFSTLRNHINSIASSKWITLEFSKLGYIGKLYHSHDLPLLARFLYSFYQEMPCDFLLSHFRTLLMQDKVIRFRPSLFQHMGSYSSFKGTYNNLKDEDFVEDFADNPAADIYTNIEYFDTHTPNKAYIQDSDFFWGKTPIGKGNYFLVAFFKPVLISRVRVQTGRDKKDEIAYAVVEVGKTLVKKESTVECSDILTLGSLEHGQFDKPANKELENTNVSCVQIRITASQTDWVIIHSIQVWTKGDKTVGAVATQ